MSDLVRDVINQLGPDQFQAMARQLGVTPSQAQAAVHQAVPMMVGGLARNASSDTGASNLHGALQRDHAGVNPANLLGSILGGASGRDGLGIIGHIFGNRRDQAAQGLGQSSGISGPAAAQLMAMLAPVVMAALGNMTRSQNLDANRLGRELDQQPAVQGGLAGGLLNSLFDRDGDGQVSTAEMMQAGGALLRAFNKPS